MCKHNYITEHTLLTGRVEKARGVSLFVLLVHHAMLIIEKCLLLRPSTFVSLIRWKFLAGLRRAATLASTVFRNQRSLNHTRVSPSTTPAGLSAREAADDSHYDRDYALCDCQYGDRHCV